MCQCGISLTHSSIAQALADPVAVAVDAKISAQRASVHRSSPDDSLKAISPTVQPQAGPDQPLLRPVRTLLPAGSGPLPTPHAVPHQSPLKQYSRPPAVAQASSGNSGRSSSSSSFDEEVAAASHGSSEVSYSHVTPYVGAATEGSSNSVSASSPLISGGGGGATSATGRGRRPRSVQRNAQDQV